jgi:putative spermidine/putrescine transport system permease protein
MGGWRTRERIVLAVAGVVIVFFLLAPMILIIPVAFSSSQSLEFPPRGFSTRWFERLFTDPLWRDALVTSVQAAIGTVVLSLIVAIPLSLGLVRGRFLGRSLVYGLVLAPMVVPTVIVAIGVYFVWAVGWQIGPLKFGGHLVGSIAGFVLAHTALAIPLVVILVSTSLRTIDRNLELAAAGLGANPWRTFWWITLPLMLPGVAAGAVLAFLTSWDETIVSFFLTSAQVSTLPVRMFVQVRESVDPTVAAASALLMGITAILFLPILLARGSGQVAR